MKKVEEVKKATTVPCILYLQFQCWRFETIYQRLEQQNGILSSDETLDLLQEVGNQWTEWSAVYLMNPRGFRIAIDFNFDPIYDFYLFPLW